MIAADVLQHIGDTLEARKESSPSSSYVASLFHKGEDAILKKVAEEAAEVLMASKDKDRLHLVREVADLWFHSMVALAQFGLTPADVVAELARREGLSGLQEFAQRRQQPAR